MNSERLVEVLNNCGYNARPFNPKDTLDRPWGPGEPEILARMQEPYFVAIMFDTALEIWFLGVALGQQLTPEELAAFYCDEAVQCVPFGFENSKLMVYWPGFQWTEECNDKGTMSFSGRTK